jgi:hypothetical protein
MLDILNPDFQRTGGTPVDGAGDAVKLYAQTGKGYEIQDSSLTAGTKNLEGSVCGNVWTIIAAISGDAQGAISDHYHFIRLNLGTYASGDATVKVIDPRQE